jgi:hypothetical protein
MTQTKGAQDGHFTKLLNGTGNGDTEPPRDKLTETWLAVLKFLANDNLEAAYRLVLQT